MLLVASSKIKMRGFIKTARAMPAAGGAIACYTKALESRNGKCFRRVTEEGYSTLQESEVQMQNSRIR
jgi:hypothetical protein